ncbi:XkdF-like putative serine protease domain-containing protein [Lachnospiraceae bacterium ZAX-1]
MSGARTFKQKKQKRSESHNLEVMKSDDDKRLVFGWASIAVRVDGEAIEDLQGDIIDIDDLESAAYEYTANFGIAGEMHERGGVGRLVESLVFSKTKAAALGIPPDILPEGWWVGFRIDDPDVWEKVKKGEYSMFSIEGTGVRIPIEEG